MVQQLWHHQATENFQFHYNLMGHPHILSIVDLNVSIRCLIVYVCICKSIAYFKSLYICFCIKFFTLPKILFGVGCEVGIQFYYFLEAQLPQCLSHNHFLSINFKCYLFCILNYLMYLVGFVGLLFCLNDLICPFISSNISLKNILTLYILKSSSSHLVSKTICC